jgi:outer membrane protein assembly factor BamB
VSATRPLRFIERVLALSALVACACGGGQTRLNLFSTDWEDDRGASIERIRQRIAGTAIPPSADIAVGVTRDGDSIVGLPLSTGESQWTFAHPVEGRPTVAGNLVIGSGDGELFALDAATGRVLWKRPTGGLALLGAGDDGSVTVATFRQAGAIGSVLLAITHDGEVVRQIETDKALGAPAVVGRMAFVPWAGQYVSVIDLTNGNEAARVTLRAESSRAFTESGALWFGELGFIRFDERIREASRGKASTVMVPARDLPGMPKLMAAGSVPLPATATAEDKVRLYARPVSRGDGAGIEEGRFFATYFRVAMGFDGNGAKLAWARLEGADFLAGAAAPGGVVLCDERGTVVALEAKGGAVTAQWDLGRPLRTCVVNMDEGHIAATADGATTKPLIAELEEIVRADDPQLAAAQRMLLRELASLPDESATKTLVDLASDPRTGPALLVDARAALAKRRNGASYMEAALERHYDYLRDVLRAPPVGPMAEALGAMNEKAAAPLLASHLLDPSDTEDDVKQAAAALAVVGGPAEVPAMQQFFGMYRASTDDDDVAAAVVSIGQALVTLRGTQGRAEVLAAVDDPMTVPYARDRLGTLLSPPEDAGAD